MQSHEDIPFYGVDIIRRREQHYVNEILQNFKGRTADEKLKQEIYDELQRHKHLGLIKMPFKVVLRLDPTGKFPSYVEVILDTKV